MEENKKCCEGEVSVKNENCCSTSKCCPCSWKKCHMVRNILVIIIIMIAFCLGTQFGELKSEVRGNRGGYDFMMNRNYRNIKPIQINEKLTTPEAPTTQVAQ